MSTESPLSHEAESLSRVSLFKRLVLAELETLAKDVDQINFKAGETIFNESDKGDALYVVDTGTVRIWVLDEDVKPVTLAELKTGDFFGELAVLDRGARSTNATAITDTELHRLSSDDFQGFLMKHPDVAIDVICEIGAHVQTNTLVSQRVAKYQRGDGAAPTIGEYQISGLVRWFMTFIIIYVFSCRMDGRVRLSTTGTAERRSVITCYFFELHVSMTAALQAPIIMMSQNRAAEKDRLAAEQDFKVNLKSELMLEELMRKSSARDSQMQEVVDTVKGLKGR